MDSDLAQPDDNPDTPKVSHREQRRVLIADVCGHAYAAVIERAAELRYGLGYAADGRTDEATLVSVTYNQARYEAVLINRRYTVGARAHVANRHRNALTLAALCEAAMLILQAPPLNKKEPVVSALTSQHIWRMVRAIEQDDQHTGD
jgi:hypothetical protein